MTTHLWIVRHGQTEWNATGRFQGHSDTPLNTAGVCQAEAVGRRLAARPDAQITAIYASDLQRAWQTAEIIRRTLPGGPTIPLIPEPRLREMRFGSWEGLTYTEIQQRQPELLARWQANLERTAPPEGETLLELAERVETAYAAILAAQPAATVLIVAHGGPLQMLVARAIGLPVARYWQVYLSNASLSQLSIYPEGAILNLLNSREHLE